MSTTVEVDHRNITPEAVDAAIKQAVSLAVGYTILRAHDGMETSDMLTAIEVDDGVEVHTRWRFTVRVERAPAAPEAVH